MVFKNKNKKVAMSGNKIFIGKEEIKQVEWTDFPEKQISSFPDPHK